VEFSGPIHVERQVRLDLDRWSVLLAQQIDVLFPEIGDDQLWFFRGSKPAAYPGLKVVLELVEKPAQAALVARDQVCRATPARGDRVIGLGIGIVLGIGIGHSGGSPGFRAMTC